MSTTTVEEYFPAAVNDPILAELRQIFVESFYENYKGIEPSLNLSKGKTLLPWLQETFDEMQDEMIDKKCRTFILRRDSIIIGLMTINEMSDKSIYIAQLAIHPSFQRRGYGNTLMGHLINVYGSHSTCEILCRRVNKPALDFYKKKSAKMMDDEHIATKYGYNPVNYVGFQLITNQ